MGGSGFRARFINRSGLEMRENELKILSYGNRKYYEEAEMARPAKEPRPGQFLSETTGHSMSVGG